MYQVVKLVKVQKKRGERVYPCYLIYLPRRVVEALGPVERFEVRLRPEDGRVAILLVPP